MFTFVAMLIIMVIAYNGIWIFVVYIHNCFYQVLIIDDIVINQEYTLVCRRFKDFVTLMYIGILFKPMNSHQSSFCYQYKLVW